MVTKSILIIRIIIISPLNCHITEHVPHGPHGDISVLEKQRDYIFAID